MSKLLSDLTSLAEANANKIIAYCDTKGIDILIYCTLRTLQEQARLYRQGREISVINTKVASLRAKGYDELADILINVGPQHGDTIVTNAGPGESWHNFGEAFDAVPLKDGKAIWSNGPDYKIYGEAVRSVGMQWAGDWTNFREFPHAQLRIGSNPLKTMTAVEVRELLKSSGLL